LDNKLQPQRKGLLFNIIPVIQSRRIRWAGHVARPGETRDTYRVLEEKLEEKGPLTRSGRR
jgi:hypothetical protein